MTPSLCLRMVPGKVLRVRGPSLIDQLRAKQTNVTLMPVKLLSYNVHNIVGDSIQVACNRTLHHRLRSIDVHRQLTCCCSLSRHASTPLHTCTCILCTCISSVEGLPSFAGVNKNMEESFVMLAGSASTLRQAPAHASSCGTALQPLDAKFAQMARVFEIASEATKASNPLTCDSPATVLASA